MKLLIKNGMVIDPAAKFEGVADVLAVLFSLRGKLNEKKNH